MKKKMGMIKKVARKIKAVMFTKRKIRFVRKASQSPGAPQVPVQENRVQSKPAASPERLGLSWVQREAPKMAGKISVIMLPRHRILWGNTPTGKETRLADHDIVEQVTAVGLQTLGIGLYSLAAQYGASANAVLMKNMLYVALPDIGIIQTEIRYRVLKNGQGIMLYMTPGLMNVEHGSRAASDAAERILAELSQVRIEEGIMTEQTRSFFVHGAKAIIENINSKGNIQYELNCATGLKGKVCLVAGVEVSGKSAEVIKKFTEENALVFADMELGGRPDEFMKSVITQHRQKGEESESEVSQTADIPSVYQLPLITRKKGMPFMTIPDMKVFVEKAKEFGISRLEVEVFTPGTLSIDILNVDWIQELYDLRDAVPWHLIKVNNMINRWKDRDANSQGHPDEDFVAQKRKEVDELVKEIVKLVFEEGGESMKAFENRWNVDDAPGMAKALCRKWRERGMPPGTPDKLYEQYVNIVGAYQLRQAMDGIKNKDNKTEVAVNFGVTKKSKASIERLTTIKQSSGE